MVNQPLLILKAPVCFADLHGAPLIVMVVLERRKGRPGERGVSGSRFESELEACDANETIFPLMPVDTALMLHARDRRRGGEGVRGEG